MTAKAIAAMAACLTCAFSQARGSGDGADPVRVYPTPKRFNVDLAD